MTISDPTVKEIPVFFSQQLSPYLYLLQHPIRNTFYSVKEKSKISAKFKPNSEYLEMEIPLQEKFFDNKNSHKSCQEGDGEGGEKKIYLSSTLLPSQSTNHLQYMTGVMREGELHLTPIHSILQLRPQFKSIDEKEMKAKVEKRKAFDSEHGIDSAHSTNMQQKQKIISFQMKKRESEEQIQQKQQSFAFLNKQQEEESFIDLEGFSVETAESDMVYERLFAKDKSEILFESEGDYLKILCPKIPPQNTATAISDKGIEKKMEKMEKNEFTEFTVKTEKPEDTKKSQSLSILSDFIKSLFKEKHILNFDFILNEIRTQNPTNTIFSFADFELKTILSAFTFCIQESYFIMKELEGEGKEFNEARCCVIGLFSGKASLRKSEIMAAIKEEIGVEIGAVEYNRIMKGLAESSGSQWIFKTQ